MPKAIADMNRDAGDAGAERRRNAAVRFEGVSKRFGAVAALHEISFLIRRGEFMTLLGPSGCGKTTVLNLIAGFFSSDGGEIFVDGELVNDVPTYKRQVGMVFQNYALFPHMSVAANIGYGLQARHLPKGEIERRLREVLALVRLAGYEDRRPRELSGGQQQRVALARALVISPKVLLLDEPFSALDKNLRASMQVELREIQRKLGVTTVFVTHDQGEALSLSDRIAVMSEGRIRQLDTPEEIYRRPCERFVASFVGDTNILRAHIESVDANCAIVALGAARIKVASAPLRGLAISAAVDLFVRPEQLRLTELNEPRASTGAIISQVYQGGHVDIYLECADSVAGRVLARLSGPHAMTSRPIGTQVGLSLNTDEAIAFAAS
jgi:putative spermidine/putrescine transport system ATP-binding protein